MGVELAQRDRLALHESGASDRDTVAVHGRRGPVTRKVLEAPYSENLDPSRLGTLYNGTGQRVLRLALDGGHVCRTWAQWKAGLE